MIPFEKSDLSNSFLDEFNRCLLESKSSWSSY